MPTPLHTLRWTGRIKDGWLYIRDAQTGTLVQHLRLLPTGMEPHPAHEA